MLAFAFLRWETDIASIPGSLSEQLAFVREMPGGTVPIIVYSVIGIALVLLAIGPHRVQAWMKWASLDQPSPTTVTPVSEAGPSNVTTGETHRDPRRVEEETDEEFLRRHCRELAQELSGFADRWEKFRDAGAETDIPFGDHRDWPQYTMGEYRRHEFDRKLASLLDDLEQLGRLTAEQRKHFNVPTDNPQTIREVAARLVAICNGD
jgi:hypothetical protein